MSNITSAHAQLQAEQEVPTHLSDILPIVNKATEEPDRDEEFIRERLAIFRSIVAENLGQGFTQVPDEILYDPTLSRAAKAVYGCLLSYMWQGDIYCWPSQKTMAARLGQGCKPRTVWSALNELQERCYIEKVRRGLGLTNMYFINPLSFVTSFKQPGRGHGHLLQVAGPERQVNVFDLQPHDALSGIRKKCESRAAKNASPEPQNLRTIHTKGIEHIGDTNSDDSRSGSAAEARETGVARKAIRKTVQHDQQVTSNTTSELQPESNIETQPPKNGAAPARAKEVEEAKQQGRRKHGRDEAAPPLPLYVASQLVPIGRRFLDQAPKSSATSVAWCYDDAHQRGMDEYGFVDFMDKARDITISKTAVITSTTPDGGVAQMRYFLTVLERKVLAWCKAFDKEVAKSQSHAVAAVGASGSAEPAPVVAPTEPEASDQPEQKHEAEAPAPKQDALPAHVTAGTEKTPQPIEYQEVFQTSDPGDGWLLKSAQHWVQELDQRFGSACRVRIVPTQCSVPEQRYGVVRVEQATGKEHDYLTFAQVRKDLTGKG